MKNKTSSFSAILILSALAATLSACNGTGAAGPSLANDWIKNPEAPVPVATSVPVTSVSPVPTVTPTPSPTVAASPVPTTSLYSGPAEVAKYVQKFVDDAKIQGRDVSADLVNPRLTIQIATLSGYGSSVIGLCESGTGLRRVTFEPNFWNAADDTQRELLVHHELGHCVLYRGHTTALLSNGAYGSIMYPIIMSNSSYYANTSYYQQELFAQAAATKVSSSSTDSAPVGMDGVTRHICNLSDLQKL